jgi:putative flippase GtrA
MTSATIALRRATRVHAGLGHSANWWQAVRFLAVGASGFAIDLVTFAALVHGAGVDYRLAAVCSNASR